MKIGYPCVNLSVPCKNRTFRLKSYSEQRLIETVDNNLDCLLEVLRFNVSHNLYFFRITSGLVPFASHQVCQFKWQAYFHNKFHIIGDYIRQHNIRISMHPDQFVIINSLDRAVWHSSVKELIYHADVLDSMGLDHTAKIQIHVGGVYQDKIESARRFISRFKELPVTVCRRLVIENDDKNYNLNDCSGISAEIGIPVLFDVFHHEQNNTGESVEKAFRIFFSTWKREDGVAMVDYSQQRIGSRRGTHAEAIDIAHFRKFLEVTKEYDFDIMLEIKNKEHSAIKAIDCTRGDERFINRL